MSLFIIQHLTQNKKEKNIVVEYFNQLQSKYNNRCIECWEDEKRNSVFFLIDAPNIEVIDKMYIPLNGSLHYKIVSDKNEVIDVLFRRKNETNYDIKEIETEDEIYKDPRFRAILVTQSINPRLLQHKLGIHKAYKILSESETVVFKLLKEYGGIEIESEKESVIASFASSCQSLECAVAIQEKLNKAANLLNLNIGIHAGLIEAYDNPLQNEIVKTANYLCCIGKKNQIIISSIVHELFTDYNSPRISGDPDRVRWLFPCEGDFLYTFMESLTKNYQNPNLKVDDFCNDLLMSKSQIYRQCMTILGGSINTLLLEYRLLRSLEILNKTDSNVTQTAFETGFSSASYFSKCFKNRFNMPPKAFLINSVAT